MPLFGIYSKIENVTTVFYFTKIDIVLERVRLVREIEKWEDRKWWKDRKNFNFSHFCLVESKKVEMKKVNLCKFTHTPLLKNLLNHFFHELCRFWLSIYFIY